MWLRLRQIALVAHKLALIAQDMHDVFGLEVGFRDPGVKTFGLENALFPVGNQFIEVVSPIQENTAGGRYLDRRSGDGGFDLIAANRTKALEAATRLGKRASDGTIQVCGMRMNLVDA